MKYLVLIAVFLLSVNIARAADAPVSVPGALEQSEKDLARAHESLVTVLPKSARNSAYQQQVGWFKFRNATCDLEGKEHEAPDDARNAVMACTAQMNKERTAKLIEMKRIFKAAAK